MEVFEVDGFRNDDNSPDSSNSDTDEAEEEEQDGDSQAQALGDEQEEEEVLEIPPARTRYFIVQARHGPKIFTNY